MADKKNKKIENMTTSELVKVMGGPSRIKRKNAAKRLAMQVKENPEKFKKNIPDFIDALSRPEAQTRWEALNALTTLVPIDTNACKAAIEGAEEALFDEQTELIRESAMRFLCRYGATSKTRSKEVWPLIKEALQMYHGEIEYDKLIARVQWFATGRLNNDVKKDFRATIREISNSVVGPTKNRLDKTLMILNSRAKDKQATFLNPNTQKSKASEKPQTKKPAAKKTTTKKASSKKTATKAKKTEKPAKKTSVKKTTKKPAAKKTTKKINKKPAKKTMKK